MGLIINPFQVVPGGVPAPAFTNVAGSWGLFNLNNAGYPLGQTVGYDVYSPTFTGTLPYPADWGYISEHGTPPFLLDILSDQNSNANDLTAAGAARPTVYNTTPVVVTGIGAGTYTYRTQFNGFAFYVLQGQPTGTPAFNTPYALYGDDFWYFTDSGGSPTAASDDIPSFPWLAMWDPLTVTVVAGTGQGEIVFDGTANGMQSANRIDAGKEFTINAVFRLTSSNPTGVLIERGDNPLAADGGVSVRFVAGVLTASVSAPTTHLLNTRTKSISDRNPHILSLRVKTDAVAGIDQVTMLVDGSATGVGAPITTDLASEDLAFEKVSLGARNNAASDFLPCTIRTDIFLQGTKLSDADNAIVYAYFNWLNGLYVGPS